jgi:hypothetical protein
MQSAAVGPECGSCRQVSLLLRFAGADPAPGLTVTVVYKLSEDGRNASLLAGGSGQALQRLTVQVPQTACTWSASTGTASPA